MFKKSEEGERYRYKIVNTEAQHNILYGESATYSETDLYDNNPTTDKNILTLQDYEIDDSSKRNFYLITNNIPEDQVGEVVKEDGNCSTLSLLASSGEKSGGEKLDTLRSGESLIKQFNFDTSKYNGDTEKCVAFWRTLMQTDIKPVKCTLLKGSASRTTVQQMEEASDHDSCMWYKALVELQRRKMDEAAFATASQQCKFCEREESYSKFKKRQGQKYSDSELGDYGDITCLNYWNITQTQKVNAAVDVQHSSLAVLKSNDKDKPLTYSCKQICAVNEQNIMKSLDSDRCKCRKTYCQCNNCDDDDEREILPLPSFADDDKQTLVTDEQSATKSLDSDICKCRRMHCLCNNYESSSEKGDNEMRIIQSSSCVHDDKQLTEEQTFTTDERYTEKSFDSDPCKCRRMHCYCNNGDVSSAKDDDEMKTPQSSSCVRGDKQSLEEQTVVTDEQYRRKSLDSDRCKCGRRHCQCSNCDESPTDNAEIHSPLTENLKPSKTSLSTSTINEDDLTKQKDKTEEDLQVSKGILQKCDICQTYCKCWNHKIEMSKRFLDESRFELCNQSTQNKLCGTEEEEEKQVEEVKKLCIICGHDDCCCDGPRYEPRNPFPFIKFDEHMAASVFIPKKESCLSKIKLCTRAEQISQSALQKKIVEHSKENVCFEEKRDGMSNNIEQEREAYKLDDNKMPSQKVRNVRKKLFITPEQRAKEINQNKVTLELNKYGIPQVVRYADGRLAPKPKTSYDDLSSESGNDFRVA